METENQKHWEEVYETKSPDEVSWTQLNPEQSMAMIREAEIEKNDAIIDVGGGDSLLVDYLLAEGYNNITVLDISAKAIERTKKRLGEKAQNVTWVVSDILDFKPVRQYKIWHDRATFHFLTTASQKEHYKDLVEKAIGNGHLILGTFSLIGPERCSGLSVSRYDMSALAEVFKGAFVVNKHFTVDHVTPFQTSQNFLFVDFIKTQN